MKRRGGSPSVSSLGFSSAVAVALEDNEERGKKVSEGRGEGEGMETRVKGGEAGAKGRFYIQFVYVQKYQK